MIKGFDNHIGDILKIIDSKLAHRNITIQQRPLNAAIDFVNDFIIEIQGDSKDNFIEKPWFHNIYDSIYKWYCDRYGDALKKKSNNTTSGVILIHRTPFEIRIPMILKKKGEADKTVWITFPNSILPEEELIDWIVAPPNLDSLNSEIINDIYDQISQVGTAMRSIKVNLMTATFSDDAVKRMAFGIQVHIEAAVNDILNPHHYGVSIGFWDLHMAVEKSLKIFLIQKGTPNPYSHNLSDLYYPAINDHGLKLEQKLFDNLPSDKEAIRYRYGDELGTTQRYAFSVYRSVLEIVQVCTSALTRELIMNNASFLIKNPLMRNKKKNV